MQVLSTIRVIFGGNVENVLHVLQFTGHFAGETEKSTALFALLWSW
jgi:hypothetical protein